MDLSRRIVRNRHDSLGIVNPAQLRQTGSRLLINLPEWLRGQDLAVLRANRPLASQLKSLSGLPTLWPGESFAGGRLSEYGRPLHRSASASSFCATDVVGHVKVRYNSGGLTVLRN
jgi:hypothetical protein